MKLLKKFNDIKYSVINPKIKIHKNGKTFFVRNSVRWNNFWTKRYEPSKWEPYTFTIFDKFLDKEYSYIDIGSWIGPTVLYGCQLAKRCYGIEPDPVAFKNLKKNVALNPNLKSCISLSNKCISDSNGFVYLSPKNSSDRGNSESSTVYEKPLKSWKVPALTLQQFYIDNSIEDCNFIKMDIEGGEFSVLPSLKHFLENEKPTIYLSLHPHLVKNPSKKIEKICEVINQYDNIYNNKLCKLELDFLSNPENFDKSYEVILTDKSLSPIA